MILNSWQCTFELSTEHHRLFLFLKSPRHVKPKFRLSPVTQVQFAHPQLHPKSPKRLTAAPAIFVDKLDMEYDDAHSVRILFLQVQLYATTKDELPGLMVPISHGPSTRIF